MQSLAGSFLIAKPVLKEPTFAQAVILMLAHNDEGAYGVIVNRALPVEGVPFPVVFGGPCESEGLIMIHGYPDWVSGDPGFLKELDVDENEVAPGIYVGDAESLNRAAKLKLGPSGKVRVCRGYAGWGPGQLEGELATGVWAVTKATGDILWETPMDDLWLRLVPSSLPQPSVN